MSVQFARLVGYGLGGTGQSSGEVALVDVVLVEFDKVQIFVKGSMEASTGAANTESDEVHCTIKKVEMLKE